MEKPISPKSQRFLEGQATLRTANAEKRKIAEAEWAVPIEDTIVNFGPPSDPGWLPPRAKIPIEAALNKGRDKIRNAPAKRNLFICEICEAWADALLGIYLISIGLHKDTKLPLDGRYARLAPLLAEDAISENVLGRVLSLIKEHKLLPVEELDPEKLTDLVSSRTSHWLLRREAKVHHIPVPKLEFMERQLLKDAISVPAEDPEGPRKRVREEWLNSKLAGDYSDVDLGQTKKISYNTVKYKYRAGKAVREKTRRGICNALNALGITCAFLEVPE